MGRRLGAVLAVVAAGLVTAIDPASAQLFPPFRDLFSPPARALPPPAAVDDELPTDSYGRPIAPGPYSRPGGDVYRQELPPPGVDPTDPRMRGAAPGYGGSPNYGSLPPPGPEPYDPRGRVVVPPGYSNNYGPPPPPPPVYGTVPPASVEPADPRLRAPAPTYGAAPGYGPPQSYGAQPTLPGPGAPEVMRPPLSIEPDQNPVTAALPPEDRPETGPPKELPPQFRRVTVDYRTKEPAGTLIIDTPNTYLYLVLGNGKAMRYGIGVGREGFTWTGAEKVSRMAEWPDWHPPPEMIERQPYLPRFMAGGPGNPLGARALYLGKTLYRIHGTNQPSTIGTFVSSGCIRLTNEDVTDLYYRVQVGTRVVVLPGGAPPAPSASLGQGAAEPPAGPYNPLAPPPRTR